MAEAEGSFEERFSETVRQFPVIYDNGSFSLETQGACDCVCFCACFCIVVKTKSNRMFTPIQRSIN